MHACHAPYGMRHMCSHALVEQPPLGRAAVAVGTRVSRSSAVSALGCVSRSSAACVGPCSFAL
eukprot:14801180-Alexandrium_andersonii.AAC.1